MSTDKIRSIYLRPWRVDVVRREGIRSPLAISAIARAVATALDAARAPRPASVTVVLSDNEELADLRNQWSSRLIPAQSQESIDEMWATIAEQRRALAAAL